MKKAIFAILLLAAMLVSGCTEKEQTTGATGFIGGDKGLDISFETGAPPAKVPDAKQQEFEILVNIQNNGEDAVEPEEAYVKLSGFSPESFGVTLPELTKAPDQRIEPKIKTPDGKEIASAVIPVSFTGFNYQGVEVASREFPVRAEICYQYRTQAAAELCLKENFNSADTDDICQVSGARTISTSGAPVKITSMSQSTSGTDSTRFTFTIQNMDTGKIFKTDSQCADQLTNENKVFVKISGLATAPGDEVKCVGLMGGTSDAGYVTLVPGQARDVVCTFKVLNRNDRIEPFNIELSYAYWKYVDTKLLVEHTPQ